jgi:ATP-binding cassette subfamily B (MDR/TAP) protein 1
MRDLSFKIAWGVLGIMVIGTVGHILLFYAFGKASERILKRVSNAKQSPVELVLLITNCSQQVRDAAFISLMRQEVGYFDLRPFGVITSQLQQDASLIHSFSGEPIRTLVMNLASVLVGVVISFIFMW